MSTIIKIMIAVLIRLTICSETTTDSAMLKEPDAILELYSVSKSEVVNYHLEGPICFKL